MMERVALEHESGKHGIMYIKCILHTTVSVNMYTCMHSYWQDLVQIGLIFGFTYKLANVPQDQ